MTGNTPQRRARFVFEGVMTIVSIEYVVQDLKSDPSEQKRSGFMAKK